VNKFFIFTQMLACGQRCTWIFQQAAHRWRCTSWKGFQV